MNKCDFICKGKKKLIVCSDMHGKNSALEQILADEGKIDGLFFLGDGINGAYKKLENYPEMKCYLVPGNCDMMPLVPPVSFAGIDEVRIMYTHGHTLSVKTGLDRISYYAEEQCADLVMFGHTHRATYKEINGVVYLNPGALQNGEYAVVYINGKEINAEHKRIN